MVNIEGSASFLWGLSAALAILIALTRYTPRSLPGWTIVRKVTTLPSRIRFTSQPIPLRMIQAGFRTVTPFLNMAEFYPEYGTARLAEQGNLLSKRCVRIGHRLVMWITGLIRFPVARTLQRAKSPLASRWDDHVPLAALLTTGLIAGLRHSQIAQVRLSLALIRAVLTRPGQQILKQLAAGGTGASSVFVRFFRTPLVLGVCAGERTEPFGATYPRCEPIPASRTDSSFPFRWVAPMWMRLRFIRTGQRAVLALRSAARATGNNPLTDWAWRNQIRNHALIIPNVG